MTEVLSLSSQRESSFGSNFLRRSPLQPSLYVPQPQHDRSSNVEAAAYETTQGFENRLLTSLPSAAPSFPRVIHPNFSDRPSITSSQFSSLSLDERCDYAKDDIQSTSYKDTLAEMPRPLPSLEISEQLPLTSEKVPNILTLLQRASDDLNLEPEPSRHVDYLSCDWKEEDIWSTWRYLVGKRDIYTNSSRLENAAWRTWAKTMHKLKTVSPETLNWMKDHDVTWLYGPIQMSNSRNFQTDITPAVSDLPRMDSFLAKKPILKKRTASELMLQKSLSASTLIKQAVDSLRSQVCPKTVLWNGQPVLVARVYSDYMTSSSLSAPDTQSSTSTPSTSSAFASSSPSGTQTPSERRHIRFSDEVEHFIAINNLGHNQEYYYKDNIMLDSSESEDYSVIVMKSSSCRHSHDNCTTSHSSSLNYRQTIAMLLQLLL